METLELQQILNSIPGEKQNMFLMEYNDKKKNPSTAVLLAILLGGIGAHHFYLGNMMLGVLYLLFSWTGLTFIAAWIEAITLSKKVKQQNISIAQETASVLSGKMDIRL